MEGRGHEPPATGGGQEQGLWGLQAEPALSLGLAAKGSFGSVTSGADGGKSLSVWPSVKAFTGNSHSQKGGW